MSRSDNPGSRDVTRRRGDIGDSGTTACSYVVAEFGGSSIFIGEGVVLLGRGGKLSRSDELHPKDVGRCIGDIDVSVTPGCSCNIAGSCSNSEGE